MEQLVNKLTIKFEEQVNFGNSTPVRYVRLDLGDRYIGVPIPEGAEYVVLNNSLAIYPDGRMEKL